MTFDALKILLIPEKQFFITLESKKNREMFYNRGFLQATLRLAVGLSRFVKIFMVSQVRNPIRGMESFRGA